MVVKEASVVVVHIEPRRERQLPQVRKTTSLPALFFCVGKSREQQACQDRYHRDDHQEFHERKAGMTSSSCSPVGRRDPVASVKLFAFVLTTIQGSRRVGLPTIVIRCRPSPGCLRKTVNGTLVPPITASGYSA